MGPIQAFAEKTKTAERPQLLAAPKISAMASRGEGISAPDSRGAEPKSHPSGDAVRLLAARTGDPARVAEFIKEISPTVWRSCCVLAGEDGEARDLFAEIMAAIS